MEDEIITLLKKQNKILENIDRELKNIQKTML
jgi:hypothetical protein